MEEEMIDVVDDENNFIRKTTRKEVREKSLLHKISRVLIKNNEGNFLIHKRSISKDLFPGYWDIGMVETLKSNEDYNHGAKSGLKEEFGINVPTDQLEKSKIFQHKYRSGIFN